MDGGEHGRRGVEGEFIGHAIREVVRQFLYFGFHQIGGFQSVGSGGQRDADAGSGMAVIKACDAVQFRAHGYTATSRTCTRSPLSVTFRRMSANCSALVSRLCALMLKFNT